jgi:hypothetical protein
MAHEQVFLRLREILTPYRDRLAVTADTPDRFEIGLTATPADKRGMFVAAVRDGKAYASYHLMPVYAFPDLMASASPELRRRMQGKSCFNFSRVDEALFAELADLTARGIQRFRTIGVERLRTGPAGTARATLSSAQPEPAARVRTRRN